MSLTAKVPEEVLMEWDLEGNTIAQAVIYLGLPDVVVAAVVDELGLGVDDHMGVDRVHQGR